MKFFKCLGVFLAIFLVLSGCSTHLTMKGGQALVGKIENGMLKSEVKEILGSPDFRRFDGGYEQWEYRFQHALTAKKNVIIVDFVDDRVVSFNSFDDVYPGHLPAVETCPPVVLVEEGSALPYPLSFPPADDVYFRQLHRDLSEAWSDKAALEMLSQAVAERNFTVAQCIGLLEATAFGDERLQYLRVLAPAVSDMENGGKLVNAFSFESGKKAARKILLEQPVCLPKCSPEYLGEVEKHFRFLYGEMQRETFESDRMALLDAAVKAQNFTCAQCVQLLGFCKFDSEKMEYLKRLAPCILDYQNSRMLADCMELEKDEAYSLLKRYGQPH